MSERLSRFVEAIAVLGDLTVRDATRELPLEVDAGTDDSRWAFRIWKPAALATPRSELESVYRHLPARFPPLYEDLVLSYRWLEVEIVGFVNLYANPVGPTLDGLLSNMMRDSAICTVLFSEGYLPFGTAPGGNYDAICFDTRRDLGNGDMPVVRVEHESILCNGKIEKVRTESQAFAPFMESIIAAAARQ